MRHLQLALRSVDDGFPERDRKGDCRAQKLIIVSVVIRVPPVVVRIQAQLPQHCLADADLVVITAGGLNRQSQYAGVERDDLGRTRQQDVFSFGGLEDVVVRHVHDQPRRWKEARCGKPRAQRVLIHQQLVVIQTQSGAERPVAGANRVLDVGGLIQFGTASF